MKIQSKNTLVELNDQQTRAINGGWIDPLVLLRYALHRLGTIIIAAF